MAYFEFIEGPHNGIRVPLSNQFTLGRNQGNSIVLNDTSASRNHAEVRSNKNYFSLVDLGSANGTIVNGVPLPKLVPQPLYDRDEIIIGSSRMIFHAEGEEPPHSKKSTDIQSISSLELTKSKADPTSLSVVMASEEMGKVSVSATLDASRGLLDAVFDKQQSPKMLLDAVNRLQAMVKVSNDLGTVTKPEALVERIMASIFDVFPSADRAFVMLKKKNDDELTPAAARHRTSKPGQREEFAVSRTILRSVTEKKQSILSSDAQKDQRFAENQSVVNLSIRSIMYSPLLCKDELLGVIGVDTMSGRHAFNEDDLQMLTGISSQAAIAIKNADLFNAVEQETQVRTQLSRYLSPDVVEGVIEGRIPLQLGGEKKRGTILFCDIVGFTSMAENLSATEVVDKLNKYFAVVTEIITYNRGTLHKFGGDMVMAFWNVMFPDELAEEHAIRTGIEMQNAVWLFDLELESQNQRPIYLGIGCNTGEFAGGNIGGTDRMEYTIIGDNVNLAQRIESLACRWQVLVSSETFAPAKNKCVAIGLPPVIVKGRTQPIKVYSIRGYSLDSETLLLNIPVSILTPDGAVVGWGLLTKKRSLLGDSELHLSTLASIPSWNRLTVQFDLPELSSSLRLSGNVAAASKAAHNGSVTYSRIALTNLQGDPEALEFLQVGTIMETKKNWPDMKRH